MFCSIEYPTLLVSVKRRNGERWGDKSPYRLTLLIFNASARDWISSGFSLFLCRFSVLRHLETSRMMVEESMKTCCGLTWLVFNVLANCSTLYSPISPRSRFNEVIVSKERLNSMHMTFVRILNITLLLRSLQIIGSIGTLVRWFCISSWSNFYERTSWIISFYTSAFIRDQRNELRILLHIYDCEVCLIRRISIDDLIQLCTNILNRNQNI